MAIKSSWIFYYKTNVPTEKQRIFKKIKCIQWKAFLKKKRCKEHNSNGTRCKKHNTIGAGICSMHLYSNYNLRIKPSSIKHKNKKIGLGVFTTDIFPEKTVVFCADEFILPYDGEVLNIKQKINRYGESTAPYCIGGPDNDELGEFYSPFIDAALYRSTASFINHCSDGKENCIYIFNEKENRIEERALRDIYGNEELLCDYGPEYEFNGPSAGKHVTLRNNLPKPLWYKKK